MSAEKLNNTNIIEKIQISNIWSKLNFDYLEKIYWKPLNAKTKDILQWLSEKESNRDTTKYSSSKSKIEDLVRFCKNYNISQEAINTLSLDPYNNSLGLGNFSDLTTHLEDEESRLLAQQLAEAKNRIAVKKEDNEATKNRIAVKKEDNEATKNEEAWLDQDNEATKNRIAVKKEEKAEIERKYEELKQALSSVSKMQIEYGKYAKYLLKGKVEGEATGEAEKLNGTLLGGILTNKTYAKLRYLSVAWDDEKIKDEQWNEITVGEYKKTFETQYGSNIQKTLDDVEKIISDKESKLGSNTTKEPVVKWNPNGFDNSLSKLRGEFRSGNSKFDGYLDRKIEEVLSRERLTQDKGELEDIGLPWGSELRSEIAEKKNSKWEKPTEADNAKWEARKNNEVIQNMSKDKIFAVIEGIVDSEADREIYAEELYKYINDTYINATREKHPPINPHKEMQLNMLFRKSFLVYTRMIMKNQIAEQYLGKVSDMISAGWDKLLIKDDKDAIEYKEDGWMRIKYHTAQCAKHHTDSGPWLEWEITIDPNGKISITDLMWLDNQNGQNELKKTPRVLTGRIIPVNEMVHKLKDDKPTFSQQWHDRVLASDPNVYKDGDYSRALKSRVHNILSYNPNEELSENMAAASMRHTLESTKLFDTFAKFQETFPTNPPKTDTFMKYYQGSVNTIPNTPEYKSLFVMRNMMKTASGNEINRFESSVNKLMQTYTGNTSKETNPFLWEYANEKMRKMFESFVTNDRWLPRFSIEHFEKFVTAIAKDKPANIDEWLMADVKWRLEILLPWWSEKFRELTKKNSEKEAKEMESLIDSEIPSAPWGGGWLRIQAASPQLATA